MTSPPDRHDAARRFQPLALSRWGVAILACSVPLLLLADPLPGGSASWLAATAGCGWFAWRSSRVGVTVSPRTVVVRGYFWDRAIVRDRITGMTEYPSVQWVDERGRQRTTPVHSLADNPRALGSVNREGRRQATQLRQALGGDARGRRRRRRR